MKSTILIPCLIVGLGTACYAQVPIGIRAGLNFNDIVVKNTPWLPIRTYTPSIGFHVGALSKFRLTNTFTFVSEFIFVQRGANSMRTEGGNQIDIRINLNYLELPLLLSYAPAKFIHVEIGPNLGYRISAKEKTENSKKDIRDVFDKPFDLGIYGGLKFSLTDRISIISRYYYGLASPLSFELHSSTTSSPPSGSNRNLQIGMTYMLRK